MSDTTIQTAEGEATLTRVFGAPRALVYQAWIDPAHFANWYGPNGWTNPLCQLDARPGGAILIHMTSPDGMVMPIKGEFKEVVEPERLVFTHISEDGSGSATVILNTVTFEDVGGKTKLTLHSVLAQNGLGLEGAVQGMVWGWNQSLERLASELAKG